MDVLPTPRSWETKGAFRPIRGILHRFGLHPGGSWSLAWVSVFVGGVVLADPRTPAAVAGAGVFSALFGGLTLVGALAYAGRAAPIWILPAAVALGLTRAFFWVTWGVGPGHGVALLYEPAAILAAAWVVAGAPLLASRPATRWPLVVSLAGVGVLEAVDALAPGVPWLSDPRLGWFVVAPVAAFYEIGALWHWIAQREVRIERAEREQRELEDAVAHERRTTELLRRKEAWLFDFFEKAPDMLLVLTPGSCEIQRCNRKFSETLGYARRDLAGRSLLDFVDPGTLDVVRPALATPRRRLRNLELRLVRHDGSVLLVLANLALRADTHGHEEVRAVLHDVTRLPRSEDGSLDPKDFYRSLTAQVPVGIFHCDDDGRCRLVNPSFCEISGLSSDRARDHGWLGSVHPEDHARVLAALRGAARHGTSLRVRHRVTPRAGVVHRVLTECVPRLDAPGFVGSMVLLDDPEDLERTEASAPQGAAPPAQRSKVTDR